MHLIFFVSVCVKVDHQKRSLTSKGTGFGLGLEGVVLEHIPAYGMLVSIMVRLVANYKTLFTLPTLMGNPCSQT